MVPVEMIDNNVKKEPLVTIGVASYNNSLYVLETLDSVLNQDYKNTEIIIVDDCSIDNSVEIIEEWISKIDNGKKIDFIKNKINKGISNVCNTMLKNANGKYYSFVGSDDIFMSNRIAKQVEFMENKPDDVAVVYSDVYKINEKGEVANETLFEGSCFDINSAIENGTEISLLKNCFVPTPSTLIRTSSAKDINGYDESLIYEDWDFWLRLCKKYKFIYLDFLATKYRILPTSAWHSRSSKFHESTLRLLSKHLGISAEADSIIQEHINQEAEILYKGGNADAPKWLKKRWENQRSLTAGLLYGMASLGLPYKAFNMLRGFLRT